MKEQRIPVTNHFNLEEEDLLGYFILKPGITIPADVVFVTGGEVKRNEKTDTYTVTHLAMMPDIHYKHFLDNLPNSCIAAGGHLRDRKGKCKLCHTKVDTVKK